MQINLQLSECLSSLTQILSTTEICNSINLHNRNVGKIPAKIPFQRDRSFDKMQVQTLMTICKWKVSIFNHFKSCQTTLQHQQKKNYNKGFSFCRNSTFHFAIDLHCPPESHAQMGWLFKYKTSLNLFIFCCLNKFMLKGHHHPQNGDLCGWKGDEWGKIDEGFNSFFYIKNTSIK